MSLLRHGQSFSYVPCLFSSLFFAHERKKEKKREKREKGQEQASKDKTKEAKRNRPIRIPREGCSFFLTRASLYFALEIHGHLGRTGIKDDTRPITWPRRSPVGRERLGRRADPWGKKRKVERKEYVPVNIP